MTDIKISFKTDAGNTITVTREVMNQLGKLDQSINKAGSSFSGLSKNSGSALSSVNKQMQETISLSARLGMSLQKHFVDQQQAWADLQKMGAAQVAKRDFNQRIMEAAANTKAALAETSSASQKAASAVSSANKQIEVSFRSLLPHVRTGAAALGVYFGVSAVRDIIKSADAYQDMSSRLKLVSGSTQELATAQAALFRISQENRTPLEETVRLYYRMATGMRDLGKTQADTLRVVDLVGKAMRVSGASGTETAAGLQQFSQALQAGVLNGDEFRSVMENMPRVAKALTDALGVNIGTLREMSAQGKLTAETVVNALLKAGDSIEADFKKVPVTVSGAWTQLSNAVIKYLGDANEARGTTRELAASISSLADNIDVVLDPIAKFFSIEATGWAKILDGVKQYRIALGDLAAYKEQFSVNQALSTQEWNLRRQANPNPETMGESYFQKVKNDALEAALAAKKLTDQQKEVARMVYDQANKTGVSAAWALAMAEIESGFTQINKAGEILTSGKGALGAMQLTSDTANRFKVDAKDAKDNIKGGMEYMKTLYTLFDKNMVLATAAYNAGEGNVLKYGKTVPPFEETKNHVNKVTAAFKEYSDALGVANSEMENAEQTAKRLEADQKLLNSAQKDTIATAEAQAKIEGETNKTKLDAINNRIRSIQQEAKEQSDAARTYDQKLAIQSKGEEAVRQQLEAATEIGRQQIAVEEDLIQKRITALQQELNGTNEYLTQAEIKRDIKDLEAELATKTQQRAQLEQDAAQKAQEAGRSSLDMKLKEKEFIDKINADLEFQTKLYAQLQTAMASGATAEQLKLIKDQATATRTLPDNVALSEVAALQEKINKTEELKDKVSELTDTEKKVREEQLRMNQAWDQALQRMEDYAKVWEKVLGTTGKGFSEIAVSLGKYEKQLRQIERDKKEALSSKYLTQAEKETAASQAQYDSLAATFSMVADVTDSMKNMFEKGTAGYQELEAMSKVAAIASQALSIAKAVEAVMQQLANGDVYTAIPRAAAVAAMAVSFLSNIGATLNGGGTQYSAEDIRKQQEAQFTTQNSTMLGSSEISTSIKDSLEVISRNSTADLDYTRGMAQSLQRVADALDSVGTAVAQVFKINTASLNLGSKNTANLSGMRGDFGLDPITNMIFGSTKVTRDLVGQGIEVFRQALQQIIDGAFVKGRTFVDVLVTKKTSALFGLIGSTTQKIETTYGKMGEPIVRALTTVFSGIYQTLNDSAKLLGTAGGDFTNQLKDLQIKIGRIPLGADGKKNAEKIAAAISAQADRWAATLYPQMTAFQQLGEGMYKTVVRVSEGVSRATGELATLGMEAIKYSDITNKQGDVAAEIVRQTLIAQGGLSAGLRRYVDEINGTAEEIIDAYRKLVNANAMMNAAGFSGNNLDKTLINAAGGLDAFSTSMTLFLEKFISQGAKLSSDTAQLTDQFGRLGVSVPVSKDAFTDLLLGINRTTEGGKKLFGQLIALVPAFSDVQDQIDNIIGKYAEVLNPFTSISDRIKAVASDFKGLMDVSFEQIRSKGPQSQLIASLRNQRGAEWDKEQELLAKRAEAEAEITSLYEKINEEMEKPLKKRNQKSLKEFRAQIVALRAEIDYNINAALQGVSETLGGLDAQIADAVASNDAALAEKLSAERQRILQQQGNVMTKTLEGIFTDLAQTLQQAQQKLQAVISAQAALASQIAQIKGADAVAALARGRESSAMGAASGYFAALPDNRNTQNEITLIQTAQQAVMERYSAEMALLQQAAQQQAAVLQENLQLQIDAINEANQAQIDAVNAATEAQVQGINDALNADLEAVEKRHQAELEGLNAQLDAAKSLQSAIKSVADYASRMRLGTNSTLSPEARLAEAKKQYEALLARAGSGDANAVEQLSSSADAYLEAAKQYYGSSTQYQDVFNGVEAAMTAIGGMNSTDPESIQAKIDLLREQQTKELEDIKKAAQDQIKAVQDGAKDQIKALQDSAQAQIKALQEANAQAIKDLSDPEKNEAMKALREATIAQLELLSGYAEQSRIEAAQQAEEAKRIAENNARMAFEQANLLISLNDQQVRGLRDVVIALGMIPAFASGGTAGPGIALVGEKGPELVRFSRPGQVLNASDTKSALSSDAGTIEFLAGIKEELRALVVTQSNANPQMVEKLSRMDERLSKMERNQRLSV